MSLITTRSPVTLRHTFSFYVSAGRPEVIRRVSGLPDAVVVLGSSGPSVVRGLRAEGWDVAVLFDRGAYIVNAGSVDPVAWADEQESAGADRILSPGCFVAWGDRVPSFEDQVGAELERMVPGATMVLSIDHRWLTKSAGFDSMKAALRQIDAPAALVLADRGDPLGHPGAVNALIALTTTIQGLSLLRTDHAGIGALAFEAAHASVGLTPGHRHAVPPDERAFAKPNDRSKRIFVADLMDWFTSQTIAGWSTTRISPSCRYECCQGARVDRFFDERLAGDADIHNEAVLAAIANEVLEAPPESRRRYFGTMCAKAVEMYGPMGNLVNEIVPKRQLTQWAQFA